MTISSVFLPRAENATDGLWGVATSSVNWCETDYTFSFYIAEFFNTWSSFCMIAFGIFGQWSLNYLHKNLNTKSKSKENIYDPLLSQPGLLGLDRLWYTWFALQIVGWGSIAFHASLQWWSQAFDEVPMVWTAIIQLTTCMVGSYDPFPLASPGTPLTGWKSYLIPPLRRNSRGEAYTPIISTAFLIHAVTCSLLVTLFRGPSQFLVFHLLFGSVEVAGFYFAFKFTQDAKKPSNPRGVSFIQDRYSEAEYKYLEQKHKSDMGKLHKRGLFLYASAIAIWSIDLNFCDYISKVPVLYPDLAAFVAGEGIQWVETTFNPQGHAWWHLLVSVGFYHLGVLATYDRLLAGYRAFWEGIERGEPGCLELLKEENVKGRDVVRKGDVPVVQWIGRFDIAY
ncbi:hypothetical protein ABW20_dc0101963 [Dactylellina cionopaga]|nr:hypothetical protein ABW20_dc0101963 [Dactylellina cionopaga]